MRKIAAGWVAGWLLAALVPFGAEGAETSLPRTVTVTGTAEVSARPDLARVTLGAEARKPSLSQARAEVATTIDRVLALTRDLKIDPKLVNGTGLQVQPEYGWNDKDRKRVLLGYLVSRQVQVELRDLEQLGALLERAVDAGVNHVSDPQLDSSRRKDLEREALTKAVQDARLSADTLARAAGVQLGSVRSLNASSSTPIVPMYRRAGPMAAEAASAAPAATYEAGDMKFAATVTAEYELVAGQ